MTRDAPGALIAVYDCREVRRGVGCPDPPADVRLEAANPPGTVSLEAVRALAEAVEAAARGARAAVRVRGEEDLLVLPLVVLLDQGWLVAYGQPGVGVAVVRVDRYAKVLALQLLSRLRPGPCPDGWWR